MATLLLWLSWRDTEPDAQIWAHLRDRASQRSLFAGRELAGRGYRVFAAKTRDAEPGIVAERRAADGGSEILLLDRANGTDDAPRRETMQWTDARIADGTPTAAVLLNTATLTARLYRDLMGQRKLVYARIPGGLIIASGEDVLRAHPRVSAELDSMYLAAYFAALSPAPEETVFRDIRGVASGETLTFDANGESRTQQLLEPDYSWQSMRDQNVVEHFRHLLLRSVENASRGARRIGISLSAGLDSSSIAAVAARLPRAADGRILAVTQGFDDFPAIDERAMAARFSDELGIEHQSFSADHLHPYCDPTLRPICPDQPQQSPYREWKELALQKFVSAGVDIRLAGDFGDHLFAGDIEWVVDALRFRRYRLLAGQLVQLVKQGSFSEVLGDIGLRRPFSRLLRRVDDHPSRLNWLRRPYARAIRDRLEEELRRYDHFPRPAHCVLLTNAAAAFDASGEHWFLQRHGLEQRMPFRDLELTRWCLSLPADFSQRNGQRKWMLREAMRGVLPEKLRMRPKESDLTPVFNRAVSAQRETIRQFVASASPVAAIYLVEETERLNHANRAVVANWLSSSFGAWYQAQAGSC